MAWLRRKARDGWGNWPQARRDALGDSPWLVLLVLFLGLPWLRYQTGQWVLYPLHFVVGVMLLLRTMFLWKQNVAGVGRSTLWWAMGPLGLPLCFMLLMLLLREHFAAAGVLLATILSCLGWGAAAFYWGVGSRDGLPLRWLAFWMLLLVLLLGIVQWLGGQLWAGSCHLLPCMEEGAKVPYAFRGGFVQSDQYLLLLIFLLPPLGRWLFGYFRQSLVSGFFLLALTLVLVAGGAVLLGVSLAVFPLLLLLLWFSSRALNTTGNVRDGFLLKGVALLVLTGGVWVYGLLPGYLNYLPLVQTVVDSGREVKLETIEAQQVLIANRGRPLKVQLQLTNSGRLHLGNAVEPPPRIFGQVLVEAPLAAGQKPQLVTLEPSSLETPLAAGETRKVQVQLRLPAWAQRGYVEFLMESGDGGKVQLTEDSSASLGFVFPLGVEQAGDQLRRENDLSAIAARARQPFRQGEPWMMNPQTDVSWKTLVGNTLDTLFFAPIVGDGGLKSIQPLNGRGPFLFNMFWRYGLVGLLLMLWTPLLLLSYVLPAVRGGSDEGALSALLVGVSLVMLTVAGLFSAAVGSYHMLWAASLQLGYMQGRVAQLAQIGSHRNQELLIPLFWRIQASKIWRRLLSHLLASSFVPRKGFWGRLRRLLVDGWKQAKKKAAKK